MMKLNLINRRRRSEVGMATAEYAVGTLGACTIGGVLVKIGHLHYDLWVFFSHE